MHRLLNKTLLYYSGRMSSISQYSHKDFLLHAELHIQRGGSLFPTQSTVSRQQTSYTKCRSIIIHHFVLSLPTNRYCFRFARVTDLSLSPLRMVMALSPAAYPLWITKGVTSTPLSYSIFKEHESFFTLSLCIPHFFRK